MKMKWDATLVTSFEGLSQYTKFLNSGGSGPSALRLRRYLSIIMSSLTCPMSGITLKLGYEEPPVGLFG